MTCNSVCTVYILICMHMLHILWCLLILQFYFSIERGLFRIYKSLLMMKTYMYTVSVVSNMGEREIERERERVLVMSPSTNHIAPLWSCNCTLSQTVLTWGLFLVPTWYWLCNKLVIRLYMYFRDIQWNNVTFIVGIVQSFLQRHTTDTQ